MTPSRTTTAEKRRAFRKLHESGCFVIPNPWDAGSARYLQSLGFKALASTSSGAAWSQGLPDNGLSRGQVLEHLRHDGRRHRPAAERRLRERLRGGRGRRRRKRSPCRRDRRRRRVDRGLDLRPRPRGGFPLARRRTSVSARDRRRARARGAARHRRGRRRCHADRPSRMLPGGTSRYRDDRDASQGVRRGRSRLPLCAGHQDAPRRSARWSRPYDPSP